MKLLPTMLSGVSVVEAEVHRDARGGFVRAYCRDSLAALGQGLTLAQTSLSWSTQRGTIRGLHFQRPPHAEVKLVTCAAGAIFDVIVDLRPGSPTYGRWIAETLAAGGGRSMLVPQNCAHGFQTLVPDTVVLYEISVTYNAAASAGVRWDDSALAIAWPLPPSEISDRDRALPLLARL